MHGYVFHDTNGLRLLRGPTTWKGMVENALSDTARWQTEEWSNFTKFQLFAWMIINSNKKNLNQWENYHTCALWLYEKMLVLGANWEMFSFSERASRGSVDLSDVNLLRSQHVCMRPLSVVIFCTFLWSSDPLDACVSEMSEMKGDQTFQISVLSNCSEMLKPGTNLETRYSKVCQQTCKSSYKIDSGLRQTIGKIDFIHSSRKWLPAILSCGQHCSALSTGFISRLIHCRHRFFFDDPKQIGSQVYFRCHKRRKFRMQKLQWTRNGKKQTRDNPSMATGERQEQEGGYSRSTTRKMKVHFATLIDICHLKNAELEPNFQKYKGRVVLRGDIVKDDSGAYAVFTELGSSASQMTAAKVTDVIARLTDCDGQAAGAVSAYTQVKMEDAPRLHSIPKWECPDVWIRPPRNKCHGLTVKIQWFLSNEICMDTQLSGFLWERQFEKVLLELGWRKSTKVGMSVCSSKTRIILIGLRGWHKIGWKEAEKGSHVEEIDEKTLIMLNPHHFLTMYFGMYSTWMQTEGNYYWTVYKDVWITYFCWSNRKVTRERKTSRKDCCVDLRHGRTSSKMRWAILRDGKQKSGATSQSFTRPRLCWRPWRIEVNLKGRISCIFDKRQK